MSKTKPQEFLKRTPDFDFSKLVNGVLKSVILPVLNGNGIVITIALDSAMSAVRASRIEPLQHIRHKGVAVDDVDDANHAPVFPRNPIKTGFVTPSKMAMQFTNPTIKPYVAKFERYELF